MELNYWMQPFPLAMSWLFNTSHPTVLKLCRYRLSPPSSSSATTRRARSCQLQTARRHTSASSSLRSHAAAPSPASRSPRPRTGWLLRPRRRRPPRCSSTWARPARPLTSPSSWHTSRARASASRPSWRPPATPSCRGPRPGAGLWRLGVTRLSRSTNCRCVLASPFPELPSW